MARHGLELLGEIPGPVRAAVTRYFDHLQFERRLSQATVDGYARDLRRYFVWAAEHDALELATVRTSDLEAYASSLAEAGLAPRSRTRALVSVRRFHSFASAEGFAPSDAGADLPLPSQGLRLPKALTIAEVEAMLATAHGDDLVSRRSSALLEFLYATGARISEAVGLDIDDLDLDNGIARLYGKGSKERLVPVGRSAIDALGTWIVRARPEILHRRSASTPAVFVNQRGTRLSRQSAWAIVSGAAASAGIDREVSPHSLRHSCATHLLEGGADIRLVQELLGHASVTTTQIYTKVTNETLREVYSTTHPRAR